VAIAAVGAVSSAIDLRTRRVPNALTFGVACAGIAAAALGHGAVSLPMALAGLGLGLAIMLPGHVIGATGAGDVKLFAALGTLLGPGATAMAFLYTAVAGGALAVIVAMSRRTLVASLTRTAALVRTGGAAAAEIEHPSAPNRFAYAPAIAIGTFVAALGL
jgi:prepilin peptidase CpaA